MLIEKIKTLAKQYAPEFIDFTYKPTALTKYAYKKNAKAKYSKGKIITEFINQTTGKLEQVALVVFGKTILRQTTF